jgi:MFS family permease
MLVPRLEHERAQRPQAVRARTVATAVFAAQGASVAAVFTTVPGVAERLDLPPLVLTVTLVGVALMAGAGSLAGLAAVRVLGTFATMRVALLSVAAALVLIGWAPGLASAVGAYALFGLAIGGLDVSLNSRAAQVERVYGRSVFGSFYAVWSLAGVGAALLTAGMAGLHWPVTIILTTQAALVLLVAIGIRSHGLPVTAGSATQLPSSPGPHAWATLIPFGVVLTIVYVVDSTISAWSSVFLHTTLTASLAVAPLAYAAYQVGTVSGRAMTDRCVHRWGARVVVRGATVITALSLLGLSTAANWEAAVAAACLVGLGTSALAPLCLASAARLDHARPEEMLARLNLFNYFGVIAGGAASGLLGSGGHFRLAYAAPAALAIPLLIAARHFSQMTTVTRPALDAGDRAAAITPS